jgi:hypothetical protein
MVLLVLVKNLLHWKVSRRWMKFIPLKLFSCKNKVPPAYLLHKFLFLNNLRASSFTVHISPYRLARSQLAISAITILEPFFNKNGWTVFLIDWAEKAWRNLATKEDVCIRNKKENQPNYERGRVKCRFFSYFKCRYLYNSHAKTQFLT